MNTVNNTPQQGVADGSASRRPRIAVAELLFEANSFAPGATTYEGFQRAYVAGQEVLTVGGGIDSIAGAVAEARRHGAELVPTTTATAMSGPPVEEGGSERLITQVLEGLAPLVGEVDGVYLSLHGALVGADMEDVDGELLMRVREMFGPDVPVAYSADLHTHFTTKMAEATSLVAGYHTLPHVDMYSTGERAMRLLLAAMGGTSLSLAWRKVRMITSAEGQDTSEVPMVDVMARVKEIIDQPGVYEACIFATQPWLDVEELGWSALVVAEDAQVAQGYADELGQMVWDRRHEILAPKVDISEAIATVNAAGPLEEPFIFSDGADSVSAGAGGDGVQLLRGFIEEPVDGDVMLMVTDAAAAEACHRAGTGGEVTVSVGGSLAPGFHSPITVTGTVTTLADGRYQSLYPPGPADIGPTAVLRINGNIHLIISTRPAGQLDYELFLRMGLDPMGARVVVAKSAGGYRAFYGKLSKRFLDIDSTGPCDSRLERMPFTKPQRPLWPLDPDTPSPW